MGMGGGGGGFNEVNITRQSYQPNMNPAAPMSRPTQPGMTANARVNQNRNRPNIFQRSAWDMNLARKRMRNPGQLKNNTLAGYMNPYTTGAIDAAMGDIDRTRQQQINQIGAAAGQAGAFGGSRHGVAEALTNEAATRQMANTAANMRNNAWGQAQNAAMYDIGNRVQAGQNLANLSQQGFGMGQAINQQQLQQGSIQQALQQELINAAKSQWAGFTGAPAQSLQYPLAALGTVPVPQKSETTKTPGIFDILGLGLSFL